MASDIYLPARNDLSHSFILFTGSLVDLNKCIASDPRMSYLGL